MGSLGWQHQSEFAMKPCGLSPKIFNVIYVLVTGSLATGSGSRQGTLDVWDCPEGLDFFGHILFNKDNVSTFKSKGINKQRGGLNGTRS